MENEQTKSKIESDEFLLKHKSITAQKLIENYENEPTICEEKESQSEKESNGKHEDEISPLKNGKIQESPPKPLPRKSISDQGSFEENCGGIIKPRPEPRPRTAGPNMSYKVDSFDLLSEFCVDYRFV